MPIALTRPLSPKIASCELTHLERTAIDFALAQRQHAEYEEALRSLGLVVEHLPQTPEFADGVFVEDAAIVLPEIAVITRPGAESRRGETASVAAALGHYRKLVAMEAPGTLDGGDVLCVDRTLYVGMSRRTNQAGRAQLESAVAPFGYRVRGVPLRDCLHLKSAVTLVAPDRLLINPRWVDASLFSYLRLIETDPAEPFAANALLVGETLVYPKGYPRTHERLEAAGLRVLAVEQSELAKAEGGVTCCSLIVG